MLMGLKTVVPLCFFPGVNEGSRMRRRRGTPLLMSQNDDYYYGDFQEEEEELDPFWKQFTRTELEERMEELEVGGPDRLAAQYVVLLTKKHPSELVREFYESASPRTTQAVTEAVAGIMGKLDGTWQTTAKQITDLCFKLQMTGYMLRNAEYTEALREVLAIDKPTRAALKRAFDAVDANNDGYLTSKEVDTLFQNIYGTKPKEKLLPTTTPDPKEKNGTSSSSSALGLSKDVDTGEQDAKRMKEVRSFLKFFDTDGDGRISFDEFCRGLGGSSRQDLNDDWKSATIEEESSRTTLPINGTIDLVFPNGNTKTVDAAQYMEELRDEAIALRKTLERLNAANPNALGPQKKSNSLKTYVDSLDPETRMALTDTMTPGARAAMAQLITFILTGGGKDGGPPPLPPNARLNIEQQFLRELMQLQIVTGYRIREYEALEVAEERLGIA